MKFDCHRSKRESSSGGCGSVLERYSDADLFVESLDEITQAV
jgi:hypothetical protein